MLSLQFIAENMHFAISLFAALVFFAVFWLNFDAWIGQGAHKKKRDILRWAGFLFVSFSFIIYATVIEQASLGDSLFGDTAALIANAMRLVGYFIIIIGQLIDPLQPKPVTTGLADLETAVTKDNDAAQPKSQAEPAKPLTLPVQPSSPAQSVTPLQSIAQPTPLVQAVKPQLATVTAQSIPVQVMQPNPDTQSPIAKAIQSPQTTAPPQPTRPAQSIAVQVVEPAQPQTFIALAASNGFGIAFALPLGGLAIVILYWRRATTGLEKHLKPVAYAFACLFGFELLAVSQAFRDTNNPTLFNLVQAFGPLWIASHVFLLAGVVILGRWVWRYLTERFMSQIFMTFTGVVLAVFMLTTVSFTFLLLHNIQDDGLNNLATATNVLNYALDSKKATTQADAEAVAANPTIMQAITAKDHKTLTSLTSTFLETKHQASLVVTTAEGEVLLRAEDPERWGDSISSDTLLRRALIGTASSTVESRSSVLAPVVSIRSIVPVRDASNNIVGTVSVSTVIDNAFVDGIKHATGLDSSIYSGNVRSATTFTGPDGVSRWIGVKETSSDVQQTVLKQGKVFKGQLDILNRQYLAVYAPLKDADNTTIGMLFIGQPEVTILQTTASLIRLTFIVSVILLALSIIPAYLIAQHITKQLE